MQLHLKDGHGPVVSLGLSVTPELGALSMSVVSIGPPVASEGISVAAVLDRWAWLIVPEEPSVAPELGALLWSVVPEGLSVAAALDASS